MKTPKKFDVIVFTAFFICVCSLTATVIMQKSMQNKLFKYSAGVGGVSNSSVYSVEKSPSVSKSAESTTEPVTDAVIGAVGYITTDSSAAENTVTEKQTKKPTSKPTEKSTEIDTVLIINKNSKKIHSSTCSNVSKMKDENKIVISSDELSHYLESGYTLCSVCHGYKE